MTVKELIEYLSNYDPNLRVCVDGYEGGYDDLIPENICAVTVSLNVHEEHYYGPHDAPKENDGAPREECVVIGR